MLPAGAELGAFPGLGRMLHGRYESPPVRVVVRSSGGGLMSADSKEPRLPPGVPIDVAPPDRRDTLRGVGDPMDPDPAPPPTPEEERRLRQEEFTVPPQLWRRPPSGWFRQFARAPEPPAAASPSEPKAAEGGATLEAPADHQAAHPPSRSTRWLPLALIALAALALFAGWRLLRTPAPSTVAVDPPATATSLSPEPPPATATPAVAQPQPAPAAPSITPAPPASAEIARPTKKPAIASPPSSATAPSTSAPPSSAHGPIY